MVTHRVTPGISVLCLRPEMLDGERLGLLTNFTGVTPHLRRNVDALLVAGLNVTALFGPEHGLRGTAQAGGSEAAGADPATGLPVFDTYLKSAAELDQLISAAGIDTLVFDMQDVGTRYWTYTWTMYDAMCSAARTGKRFVVLDRPNPLGGAAAAGPGLDPGFSSFVGRVDIPQRHGLSSGELATLFNARFLPGAVGRPVDLRVVPMLCWDRSLTFEETGLPWVAPSPNLPTLDSAVAYCGTGLFEGTNVSEGRGTTRPFEFIGAPYTDGRLPGALRDLGLPGVAFRETWFVPTFHKYAGQTVRGVQLHITDRAAFDPVGCGVSMIGVFAELYPEDFGFLPPADSAETSGAVRFIDRLWGSDSLRAAVDAGRDPRELLPGRSTPAQVYPEGVLLY